MRVSRTPPAPAPLPLACPRPQAAARGGEAGGAAAGSHQAISHSVVRIHAYAREYNILRPFQQSNIGRGVGSGVVVAPAPQSGSSTLYVLTCEHVVRDAHDIMLVFPMHGREEHPARLHALCMETDLAMIACDCDTAMLEAAQIAPLPLGSSDSLEPGDRVRAFGFPLGQNALKVTDGVYSGYQDSYLQHSSPISKGNSGGPLLDAAGRVVGINSKGITGGSASNVGYAVPARMAEVLLRDIRDAAGGAGAGPLLIRRHSLGLHVHPATPATRPYLGAEGCAAQGGGVVVRFVYNKSPLAGVVEPGDLLVGMDGRAIDEKGDVCVPWNRQKVNLYDYLERKANSDTVDLQLWTRRGGCRVVRTPLRYVHVEGFHRLMLPHELPQLTYALVAGLVIMPLRANHESVFPVVFAELGMEGLQRPHLVITDVIPGTMAYKSEVLRPGKLVERVNGARVRTMAQLSDALQQAEVRRGTPYLSVETRKRQRLVLRVADVLKEQNEKTRGPNPLWPAALPENTDAVARLIRGTMPHGARAPPRPPPPPAPAAAAPAWRPAGSAGPGSPSAASRAPSTPR